MSETKGLPSADPTPATSSAASPAAPNGASPAVPSAARPAAPTDAPSVSAPLVVANAAQSKGTGQGWLVRVRAASRDYWIAALDSPTWRAVFFVISTVLSGVLSGGLVTEITLNGTVVWRNFYLANSFWALALLSLLLFLYQRASYLRATDVKQFGDKDYCMAYMRAQCLPEAAQRAKEMIRAGNGGEFEKAMAELRRILR